MLSIALCTSLASSTLRLRANGFSYSASDAASAAAAAIRSSATLSGCALDMISGSARPAAASDAAYRSRIRSGTRCSRLLPLPELIVVTSSGYCTAAAAVLLLLLLLWPGQLARERPPRLGNHLKVNLNEVKRKLMMAVIIREALPKDCRALRGNVCKETVVSTEGSGATIHRTFIMFI
jgi:hypothetical protein